MKSSNLLNNKVTLKNTTLNMTQIFFSHFFFLNSNIPISQNIKNTVIFFISFFFLPFDDIIHKKKYGYENFLLNDLSFSGFSSWSSSFFFTIFSLLFTNSLFEFFISLGGIIEMLFE